MQNNNNIGNSWQQIIHNAGRRLDMGALDDPITETTRLQQDGPLIDYLENFDTLLARVSIAEDIAFSFFLFGLTHELEKSIRVHRPNTMVFGGCIFFAGGVITGAAENIAMLILGRILFGLGVSFTNQATLHLSKSPPPKWRGADNTGFQFIVSEQYRPELVIVFVIPLSQQLTGINIVVVYASNLFQFTGFGSDLALLSAVILGFVNLGFILVSTALVDRFG
ncbi:Sugar transport protein MST1 [Glycine soja]